MLATDIDTQVLAKGEAGMYQFDQVKHLSPERLKRFFLKGTGAHAGMVKVRPEVRAMIRFQQLNLTDRDYALRSQFDAIFCRNVMIYFDKPTQAQVLVALRAADEAGRPAVCRPLGELHLRDAGVPAARPDRLRTDSRRGAARARRSAARPTPAHTSTSGVSV